MKISKEKILTDQFFELTNPQHFINLIPEKLRNAILEIPPRYLQMNEPRLISQTYPDGIPHDTDYEVRLSFWEEYNRCFEQAKTMHLTKIITGIIPEWAFYHEICTDPGRLTFIITEPSRTQNRLKYVFHLTLNEMLRIIKMKDQINAKTGTVDTKLLDTKYKIFEYLDQRLHGSLIQRVEQKSLNVNVEASPEQIGLQSPEEIDKKLAALELELNQTLELPPAQSTIDPTKQLMERVQLEAGRVSEEFKR